MRSLVCGALQHGGDKCDINLIRALIGTKATTQKLQLRHVNSKVQPRNIRGHKDISLQLHQYHPRRPTENVILHARCTVCRGARCGGGGGGGLVYQSHQKLLGSFALVEVQVVGVGSAKRTKSPLCRRLCQCLHAQTQHITYAQECEVQHCIHSRCIVDRVDPPATPADRQWGGCSGISSGLTSSRTILLLQDVTGLKAPQGESQGR